jgi:hypothetical protein
MAGVLAWIALSCASVGLMAVALMPSTIGRMGRADAAELRRFRMFREVLTANMSPRAAAAVPSAAGRRRAVPEDPGPRR